MPRLPGIAFALSLAFLADGAGLAGSQAHDQPAPGARSPRNASYEIEARLDPAARTIRGRETIRWRNISANATSELQFHLYWNAWRDNDSTWMREWRLGATRRPLRPDAFSAIDITSLRLISDDGSAKNLTSGIRFIAPDEGNAADRTVMAVSLPSSVEPRSGLTIEVAWTSTVPRPFARTGFIDNYFFIAQWFPKLGVLEDAGWNTHRFHAHTEFYADFGVYDVRLTTPRGFVVGASGLDVETTDNADATTTHRFRGEDIHDFAWTASPHFLDLRRTFEHPSLPKVEMRLLLQQEHAAFADRYFTIVGSTLKLYGEWFGAYPYGYLTIVDPAYQSQSDGMEYPTLFTGRARYLAPRAVQVPEATTAHEAGHQWWYAMVATNEFEHAWMDEGINTYATAKVIDALFQPNRVERRYFGGFLPWVFHDIPVSRTIDGNRLAGYRPAAEADVPSTPTLQYWPATATFITYNKTALWLNTLENLVGWPALQRALASYFERWKFRHPRPDDFFQVVNESVGQDMTWFFDQVHRSSNTFDYGVQLFTSTRQVQPNPGRAAGSPPATTTGPAMYRTVVVPRRLGEATFPVEVVTTFANGERVTETWNGFDRRTMYVYERPSAAVSVEIDPRRVLLLDVNYTNNSSTLSPRASEASMKWGLKWLVWLQDLMLTYAYFV
ncbi:MAG: M1 family metallopeptidase [Vicinamibacterales bacterium]